tara:strand:+ start:5847 stop:6104 length:258 start_codon:yes stop_codon:yes gene_type:complete
MKIKFVKTILLLGLIIALTPSCKKECITNAKCKENPQNDSTLCQAYFESWIYYADEKKCKYEGYSGCSPIGFETQTECEKCECDR